MDVLQTSVPKESRTIHKTITSQKELKEKQFHIKNRNQRNLLQVFRPWLEKEGGCHN